MTATTHTGAPARNPSAHLPQFPVYPTDDQAQPVIDRFIRLPEVLQITGLSKTVLYENIKTGAFPDPYRISQRASGWKYSEVVNWADSRKRVGGAA